MPESYQSAIRIQLETLWNLLGAGPPPKPSGSGSCTAQTTPGAGDKIIKIIEVI